METLEIFFSLLKDWIWSLPLLVLIFGAGVYLTCALRGVQFRYLKYAIIQVFTREEEEGGKGDISPFEALMTSLAGAIGTGTIVGVTTGVTIGGYGALFWMWVAAFFGMAIKYSESLLSVKFRSEDRHGEMIGS